MDSIHGLTAEQVAAVMEAVANTPLPWGFDYKDAAAFRSEMVVDVLGFHPESMPCGFECPRAFDRWFSSLRT